jgi:hypothetical protein
MAASEAHRPSVTYFTFGDAEFAADIERISAALRERAVTVGALWNVLVDFWCSSPESQEPFGTELEQQEAASKPYSLAPSPADRPLLQYVTEALLQARSAPQSIECSEDTEPDLSPRSSSLQ